MMEAYRTAYVYVREAFAGTLKESFEALIRERIAILS